MLKKLQGGFAPYVLGVMVGMAGVSGVISNNIKIKSEEEKQKYVLKYQEYNKNNAKSLEISSILETAYDGAITTDKANRHTYTNIFSVNDSTLVGDITNTEGSRQVLLGTASNENTKNTIATESVLANKLSNASRSAAIYNENAARRKQSLYSFNQMKKERREIYSALTGVYPKSLPSAAPDKYKDAWGNSFTYTKNKETEGTLAHTYPWDNTKTITLPLVLPDVPVDIKVKSIEYYKNNDSIYLVTTTGDLWVVGINSDGELGLGNDTSITTWEKTNLQNVKEVVAANTYAYAITNNGEVWVAGRSVFGALGFGDRLKRYTWEKTSLSDIKSIILKGYGTYAITNGGSLWVTGYTGYIGSEGDVYQLSWSESTLTNVDSFARQFALLNNGEVWAIGYNIPGHLGLGDTTNRDTWEKTIDNIKYFYKESLSSGLSSYVIDNNNDLWVTGKNDYGQLGLGNTTDRYSWEKTTLSDVKSVVYSELSSYAITYAGDMWVAGKNDYGQLGIGNKINQNTWVKVAVSDIKKVILYDDENSNYNNNSYLLTKSGEVWSTGQNEFGELGLGNTSEVLTYTKIAINNVRDIMYEGPAISVILNDNSLYFAGKQTYGEFGIGNTDQQDTLIKSGIFNVSKSFYKDKIRYVITQSGELYAAGSNDLGNFGIGVSPGNKTTWVKIMSKDDLKK